MVSDFIKNLQAKPYQVRNRILWGITALCAVAIFIVWLATFKNELKNLNPTKPATSQTQTSAPHYLSITKSDLVNHQLNISFTLQNDTADILNFSKSSDITLAVGSKTFHPSKITDAKGEPFIQKALSHKQYPGILIFDNMPSKSGQITFDGLYFEQSPQGLFKETLTVN